jgi:8-oxo-dGTP pyrophosphatase MutT (NUDIX family)
MSVPIRDASTVLALRDGPDGLEVFMIKRSSQLGFLGGAHVFPGGAVDDADRAEHLEPHLEGFDAAAAARTFGMEDDPARARGHYVAAIRELFEEAGILLARGANAGGAWIDGADDAALEARLASYRASVAAGDLAFDRFVAELELRLATDALCYFAHWITPPQEHKRFDTRFFLAPMPERQEACHDLVESVGGEWLRPADALARYARREIELVPPTICSLDRLALHSDVRDALHAARSLDVVKVLPKIVLATDAVTILYPGDEDYEGGVARPVGPGRILNRLVLRDGLWAKP